MSAIAASTVRVSTLADGTLRLLVDIEPNDAQAAFALFGAPGRAVALAALMDGSSAVREPEPVKLKGGEWAKLAGMWCADTDFHAWIGSTTHGGIFWHPRNSDDAAEFIREVCSIDSRAQLDHSKAAWERFDESIRRPFMAWMREKGIQK